jgi:hypothetical protein
MALALLLFVFFIVIALIAMFIFPPTMWLDAFFKGMRRDK